MYEFIEMQRMELKQLLLDMKNSNEDPKDIKEVGRKLSELTLNQAFILIGIEEMLK